MLIEIFTFLYFLKVRLLNHMQFSYLLIHCNFIFGHNMIMNMKSEYDLYGVDDDMIVYMIEKDILHLL